MMVHLLRIFFTGAFRKPRELNWVIGFTMLFLGIIEGFIGYGLPDDLLSGTGLRITQGMIQASPVIGTYLNFFIFGGEFPGDDMVPRFFTVHVLLIPGSDPGAGHGPPVPGRVPQAHPVPRSRPDREERRRLPAVAGLHGQGRRLLLRRLRHHRPDGCAAADQPGLAVRPVQPGRGDGGLPARLVHGLAGRLGPHHARLRVHFWGITLSWNLIIPAC